MKQKLRLLLMTLLCTVFSSVWAGTVTLKYSGTTTQNMTGGNDAALVGLDATAWSVVGDKGGSNNYPGLNKDGGTRLYYHANGSNTITVSALNEDVTITDIAITFTSTNLTNVGVLVDGNAVTGSNGSYDINSSSFVITNGNTTNVQVHISSIKINYTEGGSSGLINPTISISGTEIEIDETVEISVPDGLTVTFASGDEDVATVDEDGVVTGVGEGTTTITAVWEEDDTYNGGSKEFTITVIDPNAPGTADNPYTVAQAIAAIDGGSTSNAYVKGIISQIDEVYTQNGNATYWISDDGTTAKQFELYRGKYLDGANFTSADQIAVGDEVVVYGKLTKYGDTYELGSGNKIVSLKHSGKEGAGLVYATSSMEKNLGDEAFTNELTNPNNLTVTYTSSDETVATVDENGEVTILAEGTTTITATSEETDDYLAGEASYELTVTNNATAIDLRGKTEAVSFDLTTFPITGGYATTTQSINLEGSDSETYAGWEALQVYKYNGGMQMKAKSGTLISPQILSDKGVIIEITKNETTQSNVVTITAGEDSSDNGTLSTTSTDTYFTLAAGDKYAVVTKITITPLSENVKQPTGLAYATATMEKNVGDEPFTNELTNPNELTVTYTSSDETVATVDENGEVTILAEGTTTITATYEEDDTYAAGEASYELTVTNNITVIDLRGKTEAITFSVMNEFIHGNGYNSYSSASLTASDGVTYAGWSATDVMTGNQTGLQMKASSGKLVSPQILSDKGVMIEVTQSPNPATITAGEESSDEGSLSTGSTDTNFTLTTGSKYTVVMEITITPLSENIKLPAGLAYATATIEKEVGDEAFTNELTNPNELAVTYTSSDETVATVDENGEVTILAEGTTTITATSEETDEYKPGTASYTLTVTKPVEPQKDNEDIYELVKDASTLADGDIIILVGENTVAAAEEGAEPTTTYFGLGTNQKSNNREAVTVTYNSDGTITGNNKLQAITLEGETGAWYFNVEDGYLYAAGSKDNWLRTETEADDNAKAAITIASDEATILFQGENTRNDLRFNYSSNNPLFSCYASTSTMAHPKIYRLVEVEEGLLGDANGDKDVTVADVTVVVNCIKNGVMDDIIFKNADVDGDGDITVTDVTLIVAIIRQ